MIRINLLPQKKAKRAEAGQQTLLVGVGIVGAAAAAVFFLVHMPLQSQIDSDRKANEDLKKKVSKLKEETKDFEQIESQRDALLAEKDAIARLQAARITPAWMLHEMAMILTKGKNPTMTPAEAKRVREDPNRQWVDGWDPKGIWITRYEENLGGACKIFGGARSDSDVTQFAQRLQASVYFDNVMPQSVAEKPGKAGDATFYNFQISGKAVY
jgi:Tfp pilus assembly protein PilN